MVELRTLLATLALGLLLAGCGGEPLPLKVGGKQSAEDQVVAELVAGLAEANAIPVQRRIGLGGSRLSLEALKRGEIDIYPEHTGAGLALLGLAGTSDTDPAPPMALLRERYAPLGLGWSAPLGFESRPGLAMLRERARSLAIDSYSDLASQADRVSVAVDPEFRARPVDGLNPLQRRYGIDFEEVLQVPARDRNKVYDYLLDGRVDVALVYSSEAQIGVFDLKVLEDDLGFFPRYDAALLYRRAALARFPALEPMLERLDSAISDDSIRALSRRVSVRGEDPGAVARSELIRLGLIEGEDRGRDRQALSLAVSLSANADGEAATVLRQLRRSFPASNVNLVRSADPLGAVLEGNVRLALVSAPAFFAPGSIDPATGLPPLRPGLEAVALVGTGFLHAFGLDPSITRIADARSIATGPAGSSGFRAAQTLIDGLQLDAELIPVQGDTPAALAAALLNSGADLALLMQPVGNSTALTLLQRGVPLLPVENWVERNNRIVFPYLQPAQLSAEHYGRFVAGDNGTKRQLAGLPKPINTLATQLVLAGPATVGEMRLSTQGPGSSFVPRALPLTDQAVERINAATGKVEDIYPVLPQAPALAPRLPQPPASLSASPTASLLAMLAVLLLGWLTFLLLRPLQEPA
ncbi:MAG TPA: glycine betaine ABC transporter substrate-binding protein, partial [Pseudohaliea sp.]|nr:glycine betaine ABC transporter substrate-binding protein [Pseudohaliea sp.]